MKGHRYVKPTRRTTGPNVMICCSPEVTNTLELIDEGECYYSAKAVWGMISYRNGTKWRGDSEPKRWHPDDWWEYVGRAIRSNVRVYLVSPNVGDMLTVTGFWLWCDRGTFRIRDGGSRGRSVPTGDQPAQKEWIGRLVLGGPPDIVHVRHNKGSLVCVSLRNYTGATWEQLARAVDYGSAGLPGGGFDTAHSQPDPCDECIITTRYMRQLVSGWIGRKCGGWGETAAQLSVKWWRNSFYTVKVCRHDNAQAVKLERNAAYGGRNAVWYYGDCGDATTIPDGSDPPPLPSPYPAIPGTVFRCDISSQYPAILATRPHPVRLMGTRDCVSVSDLTALTRYFGVIAHVRVRTDGTETPRKGASEPSYLPGTYDTTLAGPELEQCLVRGEIVQCYGAAYYELCYPLRDYANHLLLERRRCREAGDECGVLFAKCLSTAIGGKFSQRSTVREPCPQVINPFGGWGPFTRIGSDGRTEHYVSVAGLAFREVQREGGGKLLAAVYCFLTSYGRVQMRGIREALLPIVPYSQCTDGIWVGETGRDALERLSLLGDGTPGTLREVSRHAYARWYTPNHYYVDGRWTLSGYRTGSVVNPDLSVIEFRDRNPVRSVAYKAPAGIKRLGVKRTLSGTGSRVKVGSDGWLV